ncbi:NAD-dependent dihydropyrimidine dehydrogenase subunit PreA [Candidatus Acetothermia bacterium]|nr:NAD-dependent dihydropyrimidine dehydrogenase subunit PreA [Candidatus Acetothermia bacterium]MBI3459713.1 NAD-dependent dihydropyrimidine dehydrogenase subunit PreA [Candidatus Acetothermia bacterium]MBI3661195.1 NAD-dependent dihydropyrimidine dehydrogenase subunit PreA [Candidatus Acetothermia bacterium]
MVDLSVKIAGLKSPNPFWVASGPPSNTLYQANKAFEAGWGGFVWKTIGAPILNVTNRYGGIDYGGKRVIGFNNIELISDRPLSVNLKEIAEAKNRWPDRLVIVSLMVESKREAWHEIVKRTQDTGCDAIELNYGCPHGMSERGMGSAVGQVPEYCTMITEWVMEAAQIPVFVKLTPNVTNIVASAHAVKKANADGISMINTINSIMGVDLDSLETQPHVHGKGGHGGYAGPAVKPIGLHLVSQVAKDSEVGLAISGIGGVETWRDATEYMLLGASTVQVCTGIMKLGFRIVEDMIDGLTHWMEEKGFQNTHDFIGKSVPRVSDYKDFDIMYKTIAKIDYDKCIKCNLCYVACEDGAHQAIELVSQNGQRYPRILDDECVGCRMCELVCPVHCISMIDVDRGHGEKSWSQIVAENPGIDQDWGKMEAWRKKHGFVIH